jgi:hypothetical protein
MTDADDEEASEHLAWEAKMQAEIDRLKAELRQYKQALDGYAIVPVEPTAAMLKAAQTAWSHDAFKRTSTLWKAMIAAAGEHK